MPEDPIEKRNKILDQPPPKPANFERWRKQILLKDIVNDSTVNQAGWVGQAVKADPRVRVIDTTSGAGIAKCIVRFTILAGGVDRPPSEAGSIEFAVTQTDANGYATSGKWVLGSRAGEYKLIAAADGLPGKKVEFTARAAVPRPRPTPKRTTGASGPRPRPREPAEAARARRRRRDKRMRVV